MIRKYFAAIMMAVMVAAAVPILVGTASAQRHDGGSYSDRNRDRSRQGYSGRTLDRYYGSNVYDDNGYSGSNGSGTYDRHRKAVNIGVATGAGALLGAIFGGKKGALIGAAAGAVTGAVVTAKQRPRNYERYRY